MLLGPGGRPEKRRVQLACNAGVGVTITVVVDGATVIESDETVVELGRGNWMLVDMATHADLLQRAMQAETLAGQIATLRPDSRRRRRIQQRKDRRN